jgi:transposase
MRKGTISLNQREQQRLMVLNQVERGDLTGEDAAVLMGLGLRQVRRLLAAYRREGGAALAHGNRGRRPVHALSEEIRKQIVDLARGRYEGFNHHHLTELLAEREGLVVSRSSVWRILSAAGLKSSRHRRAAKHRCRRERYPQEGMLLQIDGSQHDWLEARGPYLTLVAAIDDATGTVAGAVFRDQEDAHGYFLMLREVISANGVPLALYSDRHGIFQRSLKEPETLEEQLAGERQPTQFGRSLKELGIQAVFALSPQAKGRIERLFGTLQDRLVSELRLAGAATMEMANRTLRDFLPRFNARFGVPASRPGKTYRQPSTADLDGVLCFKYQRSVAADNTIRFAGRTLQLLPGLQRPSYTHASVEVQERLDGSLLVCYRGETIAFVQAPDNPVKLRARKTCSVPHVETPRKPAVPASTNMCSHHRKPGPNHPWRRSLRVTKSLNR